MIGTVWRGPGRGALRNAALAAYQRIVAQARAPAFYSGCGVPDTLDGRFELVCLHAFLYLNRLKAEHKRGEALGQLVFDTMFADFDRSLREIGTGDLRVGREVNRMAEAFYGRIQAYEEGLSGDDGVLRPALARNLYGTVQPGPSPGDLERMAGYLRGESSALERQGTDELLAGRVVFGAPPHE
jgi:cytochrome b pre-mRNA-processing protein 3